MKIFILWDGTDCECDYLIDVFLDENIAKKVRQEYNNKIESLVQKKLDNQYYIEEREIRQK